jgi:hypothetical protein
MTVQSARFSIPSLKTARCNPQLESLLPGALEQGNCVCLYISTMWLAVYRRMEPTLQSSTAQAPCQALLARTLSDLATWPSKGSLLQRLSWSRASRSFLPSLMAFWCVHLCIPVEGTGREAEGGGEITRDKGNKGFCKRMVLPRSLVLLAPRCG